MNRGQGRYVMLLSVHGLVRGADLELGRDADTGGQIKYVVELARALARHPEVERVDLVTRRIEDERVDPELRGRARAPGRERAHRAHPLRPRALPGQGVALAAPRQLR